MAQVFRSFANTGHGSGWLWVDDDGNNYVVTNRHVVSQAETTAILRELPSGEQAPLCTRCPIIYVDDVLDLAVVALPRKYSAHGFPLKSGVISEGSDEPARQTENELATAAESEPENEPTATAEYLIGAGFFAEAQIGSSLATGSLFSTRGAGNWQVENQGAYALGFGFDLPLNDYVGVILATRFVQQGVKYAGFVDLGAGPTYGAVEERVSYLQLPLMLRVSVPIRTPHFTLRFEGRAGVGMDALVDAQVELDGLWSDDYFAEFRTLNLSLLAGGGAEFGVGAKRNFFIGFDVLFDKHARPEWDVNPFGSNVNSQYAAIFVGAHIKHEWGH